MGLNKKVVLVTGSARGVGAAIARLYACEGADVVVHFNEAANEANLLVLDLLKLGSDASCYQADLTCNNDVGEMIFKVIERYGRLDVLVNNAGYYQPKRFVETVPTDWEQEIGIGLFGVVHTMHAVLPHMLKSGCGNIVNLCGDSALVGEKFLSLTAASRGGVIALTKSIAKEVGSSGVRANVVSLGLIETHRTDEMWLEKNRDKILKFYPINRIGQPIDIAGMVVFLSSQHASWVTGQVVSVNGGFSML
jgi:NAD(P)-dependent dehydrogenase (short-subunit alcohol dehydrogenase family)